MHTHTSTMEKKIAPHICFWVVDDVGVNYVGKEHTSHLLSANR